MRQVIDGKIYDTETATLLHGWDNGNSHGDFKYRSKDLYRTPRGRYFLHHVGGAMTDMAVSVGNNSYGGSETLEVIDRETAMRFLESHGGSNVLIREFPDSVEEG